MQPNLRQLFAWLETMPRYVPSPNTLEIPVAREIAAKFGEDLVDVMSDYREANRCGATPLPRSDLHGNGLGMFHNTERLFAGYLYDLHYVAACDSAQAVRNEF